MNTGPFAALSAADPARDVALSADEAQHVVRSAIERPRRRDAAHPRGGGGSGHARSCGARGRTRDRVAVGGG